MAVAPNTAPDLLTAALDYGARGFPVFPCHPETKQPLIKNGRNAACLDADTIRAWWTQHPAAMIGMPTGAESGVWVLDIDDPAAFEDACKIALPATRRAETGKGYHLYFTQDEARPVRNRQKHPKRGWPFPELPGAETRGEGGYVIVPPSIHPSGRTYLWTDEVEPLEPPLELLEIVLRSASDQRDDEPPRTDGIRSERSFREQVRGADTPYGLKALDGECAAIRSAGEGEQESALNEGALKIGALVAGGELQIDTARSRLISAGLGMPSYNSRDRWTADIVVKKVERALQDGARTPRSAPQSEQWDRGNYYAESEHEYDPETGEVLHSERTYRHGESIHMRSGFNPISGDTIAPEPEPDPLPLADLAHWAITTPSPKAFIMAGHIPEREVTIITGDGGTNKSTFGHQLAVCRAAGKPMLGIDTEPGVSLYLTAEDDFDRLHWVHQHICQAAGVRQQDIFGKVHISSVRGITNNELGTFDMQGRLRPAPALKRIRAALIATEATLLILDNVAHMFSGNENDRGQVTAFINLLYTLCRELGVTILLIAHRNKAGDSFSGSTAWLNAIRSQLVIERADLSVDPDGRTLSVGKANYARPGEELKFRWHDFALVIESDLPPDTARDLAVTIQASADNKLFLTCLAERNKQKRCVSEKANAQNYAPKVFDEMPESKGIGRKRIEKAMDRLFRISKIRRGTLWRDTAEGKDIAGLGEVGKDLPENPESPPETSRKVQPESSGNPQKTTGNSVHYTTYNRGAAPEGSTAPLKHDPGEILSRAGKEAADRAASHREDHS